MTCFLLVWLSIFPYKWIILHVKNLLVYWICLDILNYCCSYYFTLLLRRHWKACWINTTTHRERSKTQDKSYKKKRTIKKRNRCLQTFITFIWQREYKKYKKLKNLCDLISFIVLLGKNFLLLDRISFITNVD